MSFALSDLARNTKNVKMETFCVGYMSHIIRLVLKPNFQRVVSHLRKLALAKLLHGKKSHILSFLLLENSVKISCVVYFTHVTFSNLRDIHTSR